MAEQPSLGGAIALQGRNTVAEQLGRMQFQVAQKEADRAAKRGIEEAKRIAEIEEKFSIPKGKWNRIVLPDVLKAQAEVLEKAKTLKAERPTNWQNELQNLANNYKLNMQTLETKSREFDDYEAKTSVVNKGNTYFTKEALKYNKAFEEATSLEDFNQRLAKLGFDPTKASDFMIRSDNSISFTPIPNQKPLETLVDAIEKFDGVTADFTEKKDQFGNLVREELRIRPLTYKEAEEIKNSPKLATLYSKTPYLPSIEGTIDAILDSNEYFAIQYADERNLPLRRNPDGTINLQDREVIKQDLLQRVANMREPKTGRSTTYAPRGGTVVNVSAGEPVEQAIGQPDFNDGKFKSAETSDPGFKGGQYTFTFGKELSQAFSPGQVFDRSFKDAGPTTGGTLSNVKPDGVFILYTDDKGAPINLQRDNPDKIKKAGVFVRLKSGTNQFYYIKEENFRNLDAQVALKPTAVNQFKKYIESMKAKAANEKSKADNIAKVKKSLKED